MRRAGAMCALVIAAGCDRALGLTTTQLADGRPIDGIDLVRDLVAYYRFDELGSTSCAIDSSGNGHDGSCTVGAPTVVGGKVGSAFAFGLTTTLIEVPYAPDFDAPYGLTIAAWVAVDTPPVELCPFNKPMGTSDDDAYQFCILVGGLFFKVDAAAATLETLPPLYEWHHYAVTWDGSNAAGWVDGDLRIQVPLSSYVGDAHGLAIGADINAGAPEASFVGRLDELRVYGRALTAAEMSALAAL